MNRTPYTVNSPDLLELLDVYPWYPNRDGIMQLTLPSEGFDFRVTEDDGTYKLTVLSGGRAELIHTEASFSGGAAGIALRAAIDSLVGELA